MATPDDDDTDSARSDDQDHNDREFDNSTKPFGDETEHPLGDREAEAGKDQPQGKGKGVASPSDLAKEEMGPGGFYSTRPGEAGDTLWKRLKKVPAQRKALGALGVGGLVLPILLLITFFPTYRLPSIMGAITGVAGEAVEEIVEHRASRFAISYLIHKADVDAVAGDSLGSTLYRTWRVHKLEEKIARETGFTWKKVNGEIRMFLGEDDLGPVRTYEDVIKLTNGNPAAQKAFKLVLKIASGKRWLLSSSLAQKALKQRFPSLRFAPPVDDKSMTREQNLANFRTDMYNVVDAEQSKVFDKALLCILEDDCSHFKEHGDPVNQPSTESINEARKEEISNFAKDVDQASTDAKEDIKAGTESGEYKSPVQLTELAQRRLTTRLAAYIGGPIGLISTGATVWHYTYVAQQNNLMQRIPATAVAYATGAQAAYFSGQASNIMAGKTATYFIEDMNKLLVHIQSSQAYRAIFGGDISKGVAPEAKVNNDQTSPMRATSNALMTVQYYTMGIPFNLWYAAENAIGDAFGFLTDLVIGPILTAIFGEDYEERLMAWVTELVMPLFAGNVDAFATGAKWMNQVFVGWTANMNWYCEAYLGCKATSEMKETLNPPGLFGGLPTQTTTQDVAGLPLRDSLFSLDEPYSLTNQAIRSMPTNGPSDWLGAAVRQIGSLPSSLLTAVSGNARANSELTPQQIADITGVRQYGYGAEDLARDISPEIFAQAEPICPEDIDSETSVNLCMADRETAKALLCMYDDCPEFATGWADEPNTVAGAWSNIRRQWSPDNISAALGW